MKVVCPFTAIRPDTAAALDASGYAWEAVDVSGSDEAYWDLLAGLWRAGETFCLVEHDIVVGPGTLPSFERCPKPWCAASYRFMRGTGFVGLGCTRFRAEVMRAAPDLMTEIAALGDDKHPPKHWCRLDTLTYHRLEARGQVMCRAHGEVGHLGALDRSGHGCLQS